MLQLEINTKFKEVYREFKTGNTIVLFTPPINEDYWAFRVKLHKEQAIIGFPKFGTFGIGFAVEKDWNTNLPYQCETDKIYNHIKHNKKYKEITKEQCIKAIKMIQNVLTNNQRN
jgi:hypothetical protein